MNSEFTQQCISPNSVATLGGLPVGPVGVKAWCSFEVVSYVCGLFDNHYSTKALQ